MSAQASAASFSLKPRNVLRFGVRLCGLVLITTVLGSAARAGDDPAQVGASLDAIMRDWMQEYGVPAAALAAMKDGTIVKSFGYGGMDPAKPARLASLSKAITGVCIARLIDEGRLSFSTPLGM